MPDVPSIPEGERPAPTAFVVTRTSAWSDSNPPCAGAYRGSRTQVDYRTFRTRAQARKIDPNWFTDGSNHRRWSQGWCRDTGERPCWLIDLPDLAALLAFRRDNGSLVLHHCDWNHELLEVEIYDDYRE